MSESSKKSSHNQTKITEQKSTFVIVKNTDNQKPVQPGLGLIKTRKNHLTASLGKNSELISVIIQGFNRLDKTRNCVESVLKYTTKFEYELILVDNGSTDGTLEYFQSVVHPRKKIVRVTKNVSSVVPVMNLAEGRYIAYICNDTYVTQNWIENLMSCLKSDESIGMAVPITSNASNLQGPIPDLQFNSLEEMYAKAAAYNVSDPRLWHERIRLTIMLALFRREALDVSGAILDYGYYHDFADDDTAFRIRRAGYKIILCKDTFVHHDHVRNNLTQSQAEDFHNSIQTGKQDFRSRYFGVDAWDDVNNYEMAVISMVDPKQYSSSDQVHVLGVDVLCGTPILELKNRLRENSVFDVKLSALTPDPKYWIDLETICSGKVIVDRLNFLSDHFNHPEFDFVFLGKPINIYPDPNSLLLSLSRTIKQGGHILLKLYNTNDFLKLYQILGVKAQVGSMATSNGNYVDLDLEQLITELHSYGFSNHQILAENWQIDQKSIDLIKTTITKAGLSENVNLAISKSLIKDYSLILQKQ